MISVALSVMNHDESLMQPVRFLFGHYQGQVHTQGKIHSLPNQCIVATHTDAVLCDAGAGTDIQHIDFHPADFQSLFTEIADLLDDTPHGTFWRQPVRTVNAQPEVIDMLELLRHASPISFLRFLYVYCLGVDRRYFSGLLRHAMSGDMQFVKFIESNFLNQWTIARLAEEFDMPLRKFNILFLEKYGMPAKRWIMERRLSHSSTLLLTTSMRVLDIALECGFSNHAHFTDSFRKRFLCNPTQFRLRAAAKKLEITAQAA